MPRPRCPRRVADLPPAVFFKPRGVPLRELEEVVLAVEELEALRLADREGLYQADAAQRMGVSRTTFGRVLTEARRKVAEALTAGKAVRIEGGAWEQVAERRFGCPCGHAWSAPFGTGRPQGCPACGGQDFHRIDTAGPDGPRRRRGRAGPTGPTGSNEEPET